mmetsp:Transcript_32960/g.83144  ORF Transcript_32960/g.83144 Transcript_32960/m.83144 type:complete len:224 (+) Transcript_32960:3115-3786(+)
MARRGDTRSELSSPRRARREPYSPLGGIARDEQVDPRHPRGGAHALAHCQGWCALCTVHSGPHATQLARTVHGVAPPAPIIQYGAEDVARAAAAAELVAVAPARRCRARRGPRRAARRHRAATEAPPRGLASLGVARGLSPRQPPPGSPHARREIGGGSPRRHAVGLDGVARVWRGVPAAGEPGVQGIRQAAAAVQALGVERVVGVSGGDGESARDVEAVRHV